MKEFITLFVAFALHLVAAIPSFAQTTMHVGYAGTAVAATPLYIGVKTGTFAKYGLKVVPVHFRDGQTVTLALVSGSIDFVIGSPPALFFPAVEGADVIGVGSWNNGSPYGLASVTKIRAFKDLKGKTLATDGPGGRVHLLVNLLLAREGMSPADLQIRTIAGSAARLTALVSKNIDAAPVAPELGKRVEGLGLHFFPLEIRFVRGTLVTRRSFVDQKRKMVETFLRGISESTQILKSNQAESLATLTTILKMDKESLEHAYAIQSRDAQPDLMPTEEAIKNVLTVLAIENPKLRDVRPFQYFDLSIAQSLTNR